ncbi:septum site-determining protein MinC [Hydrogenophaga sp.]|uniref:septum site-determining protein MinC n=1 Tax=Hydrogenophaga sp. TaxID=1904254 RepID=UPI003F6D333A
MTAALTSRFIPSFEIKSTNLPVLVLELKTPDLTRLGHDLLLRFGEMPDFFDHDGVVVDLSRLNPPLDAAHRSAFEAPQDFAALTTLLHGYQLRVLGVRGASVRQTAAALAAGLVQAPGITSACSPPAAQARPSPAPMPELPAGALVIDKPLRCGQQVYARGRDLIVMAMVNAGAEVIADGHIHVYAPLRGRAIAGARGNGDARIFALAMASELICIAGVYSTGDAPMYEASFGKAAQVSLLPGPQGDHLVVDVIHG